MQITLTAEVSNKHEAEQLKRRFEMLSNPDWIASWWHISDVHQQANGGDSDEAEEIADEEAREVLRLADKYHDAEEGINWGVIESWIDHVKDERKERA